jgi:hypothetical protein
VNRKVTVPVGSDGVMGARIIGQKQLAVHGARTRMNLVPETGYRTAT